MGIHTGAPLLTNEGYVGTDVHKAARIAAAGHGRQILVSSASAALLGSDGLRDLGEHRLKDLSAPERIYQLGDGDFPPLKTLYRSNLPTPATPFVGRERELAELGEFLGRDDVRLLTLLGPGGTGKTRLALQATAAAADRYPDGVFWVPLAPLRDPGLVLEAASQALGATDGLADQVADKRLLLLLDNFEHLIAAARDLAALLRSCPNLSLVVTSRELLQLPAEQSYPVPPLDPQDGVQLFVARAKAVKPAFEPDEAVPALCDRLDNLPLALELAAARVRILSPQQLRERLTERLDLLKAGRDADPRQQTLRATIEWSYDLLDEKEQQLFARLAVFRGGCTLDAAEAVCSADLDTLQSLVDKSLVRVRDRERFWMLETIRGYARERLRESGDEEAELRQRHAEWYVELAERADREAEEGRVSQSESMSRLAAEHDNLRSALEWARDRHEGELLLRLAAALADFWRVRGFYVEARQWLALSLERAAAPAEARMKVLRAASGGAVEDGDIARAQTLVAEWRKMAEEAEDEEHLFSATNAEARIAMEKGDVDGGRAGFMTIKQLAAARGDRSREAAMAVNLGVVATLTGDYRAGLDYSMEAAELFDDLHEEGGIATALLNCGWNALGLGDAASAEDSFRRALLVAGRLGALPRIATGAAGLAAALVAKQEERRGAELLGAAESLREELQIVLNDEFEERIEKAAVATAKAALGERAFAAARSRGRAMGRDEILAFCRGE